MSTNPNGNMNPSLAGPNTAANRMAANATTRVSASENAALTLIFQRASVGMNFKTVLDSNERRVNCSESTSCGA